MGRYKNADKLQNYLTEIINPYWDRIGDVKTYGGLSDSSFYLPSRQELNSFLNQEGLANQPPDGEGFDCDDFTFILKGRAALYGRNIFKLIYSMCLGIAWGYFKWVPPSEYHSCNWVVLENSDNFEFFWLEPQTSELKPLDQCLRGRLRLMIV